MKITIKQIIAIFAISVFSLLAIIPANGQTVKSGYFLPGMLHRNKLNPAIMNREGYLGFPVIGNLNIGIKTNLGVGRFVFPMANGGLTTFMNGSVSAKDFLSGISQVNTFNADIATDIFSIGFIAGKSYNTLGLSLRSVTGANIPYALFDFMKSGMSSPGVNHYSIRNLEAHTTNYMEVFYSYARPINDQWSVGAKIKFLAGIGEARARISQMDISMSSDEWMVSSQGHLDATAIVGLDLGTDEEGVINNFTYDTSRLNITNFGFAIDAGVIYKPTNRWTISLGVTDLGYIKWKNGISAQTNSQPFRFKGFNDISGDSTTEQIDQMQEQLMGLIKFHPNNQGGYNERISALKATVNIGGEFEVVDELFSVGLLSSTRIDPVFTITEAIISANFRPTKGWFNASLTLNVSNVAISGGAVLNLCPSFFNLFIGMDYIIYSMTPQYLPVDAASPYISLGVNIPIGGRYKK